MIHSIKYQMNQVPVYPISLMQLFTMTFYSLDISYVLTTNNISVLHFLLSTYNEYSSSGSNVSSSYEYLSTRSSLYSSPKSSELTNGMKDGIVSTGRSEKEQPLNDIDNDNQFQPSIDFEVSLLGNKSVRIVIESLQDVHVLWFNTDVGNDSAAFTSMRSFRSIKKVQNHLSNGETVDCLLHKSNPIIISSLEENSTYTFCMVPHGAKRISPCNCVPVRVPERDRHLTKWIGNENKHFTITMIILSFTCSMVFGSVISYLTIKTYPDLLEGGRNVIHVRENPMERSSYISTITKGGYGDCGVVVYRGRGCSDVYKEKQQGCTTSGTGKKM